MLPAISQRMLNEKFALNDTGVTARAFRQSGCLKTTHAIEWSQGVTSGEVTVEAADTEDYTGAWSPVAVFTFGNRDTLPYVDVTAVEGNYRALRHRITQIITDGTVISKITGAV